MFPSSGTFPLCLATLARPGSMLLVLGLVYWLMPGFRTSVRHVI